ncbi:S8 family serine peptidase [Nocardioides sp. CFH 31398]|uniref:S8 family serine peptidase n=1 Tax=Nocardioides sp. CFH 31398 TaxID=2919579 RepID=UPI001F05CE27|nr:S8 family serine peptidase [Nocardioides sp. CFH 31398]MCH1869080.1 S8 family serine peptidase [Nocardioides sp. CFH 31398]
MRGGLIAVEPRAGRRRRTAGLTLAAGLVAATVVPGPAAADSEGGPVEATIPCSSAVDPGTDVAVTDQVSAPLEQMRIPEAHQIATGEGATVAIVDGPVVGLPQIPLVGGQNFESGPVTVDHGTVVAGLVAGADRQVGGESLGVGVAPGAEVLGLRIVADPEPAEVESGLPEFDTEDVVAALRWVADEARPRGIDVVNLSLNVSGDVPELEAAVEAVQDAGVIVVAATPNRDEELAEEDGATRSIPLAEPVYPAAYPGVVGVTSYVPKTDDNGEPLAPEQFIEASRDVDVAAPTIGAVSYGPNGSSCVAPGPATSWATAYVSGVLALMRQRFPDQSSQELVSRLLDTASGVADQRSTISGAGVVQPLEALTREVATDREGRLQVPEQVDDGEGGRAEPPPVRTDELAESRDDFRWWGLLAGAVLVGAVILRPLLRRTRRS